MNIVREIYRKEIAMKNRNFVTAYDVLINQTKYDWEKGEHIEYPEEFITAALNAFKSYVAATARGDRRNRIFNAKLYNVKHWGILQRLWWYPETDKVEYCCGQEWYSEHATLRDCFDYKVKERR